jgi:hypothetical protein
MDAQLDTDFPGGNGLLIDAVAGPPPTVRFAAEARNCPQAMWFHFRLSGIDGEEVRLVLANPEQTLGGPDWSRNHPVFRTRDARWQRTGNPSPVHTAAGRTEWAWTVPCPGGRVELAHCYPYQPADLEATLAELSCPWIRETIGVTMQGRWLPALYSERPDGSKPVVLLTARHHAGETPGGWVLDGLLRAVDADAHLRERVAWTAVPMVDLDDVVEGSYGKDPHPHDCNRAYGVICRPEVAAVMSECYRLKPHGLALLCDLHAPSHRERRSYVPIRGWSKDAVINPIAREFGERLQQAVPESLRSSIAHVLPPATARSRYAGTSASRWITEALETDGVCVETSYHGTETRDYGIDDFRRIGQSLAETAAEWVLHRPDTL